jgi:oligogalacturonide lyase
VIIVTHLSFHQWLDRRKIDRTRDDTLRFGKGQSFPSEHRELRDEQTGATVHQLTSHASVNHHLYFLNRSFTPDGKTVVFTSYRDGHANLYELSFPDGPIRQLTEGQGLHPFSACVSHSGEEIFFTREGSVYGFNRETLEEVCLARFSNAQLAECNLSGIGDWIVTAIRQDGHAGIAIVRTDGRESEVLLRWPKTVVHPQFHPLDDNLIEFASDPAPRMHVIRRDSGRTECLYEHGNDEFIIHETFLGQSGNLVFAVWPFTLKQLHWKTRQISTLAEFNAWHIAPDAAGKVLLCDTNHPDIGIQRVEVSSGKRQTVCFPKSSSQGSQWKKSRYALAEDWARAAAQQDLERKSNLSWMEMKTDTVYGPQWTHPHPSWHPKETHVIFTSDTSGFPQVYVAKIP